MKIDEIKTYRDLLEYLKTVTSTRDDEYVYDVGYIVQLLLAVVDNLQEHTVQGDLDDIAYKFTDPQRQFIARIAEYANRLTDEMIENEEG
jgi:hypothetical protein